MTAITLIRFDRGQETITRGTLIDCPAELLSHSQIEHYRGLKPGWSQCPLRYWVYAVMDAMGRKLVVPGLSPADEKKEKRRFGDLGLTFTKKQIEQFVGPHLVTSQTIRDERDSEFRNLTHDLRAMGAEIYSTALSARRQAEFRDKSLVDPLDSVLAAQQMLSVRLDVVDYESGFAANRPPQKIPVYKKIDKVLKCFATKFKANGVSHKIHDSNFARIFGPPIFELIPFVIVENSIKYSPRGGKLDVFIKEDAGFINIKFISLGPRLTQNEKLKIFDKNFRGNAAKGFKSSGSGIGLFGARTLTEAHYQGEISVEQGDEEVWIDAQDFYLTSFKLRFPIADHQELRPFRKRLRRRTHKQAAR